MITGSASRQRGFDRDHDRRWARDRRFERDPGGLAITYEVLVVGTIWARPSGPARSWSADAA
jgi:hypothetical protein